MYHFILYLYQLGVMVCARFNEKVRKMWRGEREAVSILRQKVDPDAQYIWFHAASLGEFEQGRPLMEQLRRDHPEYKILLTFFSPSGYEVRKNYEGADIITYLPIDTVTNARRFLRTVRPVMAFFIKYEFWYNYLHILKHRHVPVYSVSSIFRPEQVFFKWYGKEYGRVLKCFTHFFVQNEVSKELLAKIGIHDVTVTGDTRFDRVLQIKAAARQLPVVETFCEAHPVFVAGSSWEPDEEVYIPYFVKHRDWKLVVATHVVSDSRICKLIGRFAENGMQAVRYTDFDNQPMDEAKQRKLAEADVLLIDCYGLLSSIYRYATVTYVGGGFGVGIHNVLEAAVWNVPVLFGPNNERFQEAQRLLAVQGGFEVTDAESFDRQMEAFRQDPEYLRQAGDQAGSYVRDSAGATQKVMSFAGL